jgi:hypothetical protein
MSDIIYLSNVRLSFPHIIEPQRTMNEQTGKEKISFNAEFIMPMDHVGLQQFLKAYAALALDKWKDNATAIMGMIQNERRLRCFGKGEEKINKKTFLPYDGYAGQCYITAGRDTPPQLIGADGTPIDAGNTMAFQATARAMYGGCFVNAAVKPWLQDNQYGRGVRCDLVAVQFAGNGEPFGAGATDVSGIFGAVATQPAAPVAMPSAPFGAPPAGAFGAPALPPFMMGR